jgi:hypothetical protein
MRLVVGALCLGMLGLSVAAVSGCQTDHRQRAVDRRVSKVETIDNLRDDLKRADADIVASQQSLERLSTQQAGDLQRTYADFRSNVNRVEASQRRIDGRTSDLASESYRTVSDWDYRARTIEDQQLRQQSIQRGQQAQQEHEQLVAQLNDLRQQHAQYLRQLRDVQTYVAQDLTPRGLQAVNQQTQQLAQHAQQLRQQLSQTDARLEQTARAWRTDVPLADRARPAGGELQNDRVVPANRPIDRDRNINQR